MILNSPTISGSLTVTGNIIASGSITLSGSVASASFATSASNATNAISASYANNLTVAGTLTAQTLVVQTITSSVLYSSGSNVFGNNIANTQTFTGSMLVTGSITATEGNFLSAGVDGSLGSVVRISTTSTNGNARNWALVNTFDSYGDLNFRLSNAQGGNALVSGSTILTLSRIGAVTFAGTGNGIPLVIQDISAAITNQTAGYIGMSTSAFSGNNGDLVLYPRTSATSKILLMGGSVGVGTSNTTYGTLNILSKGGNLYNGLSVFSNNGTESLIGFGCDGTLAGIDVTYGATGAYQQFVIKTGGNTRMTIQSSTGDVYIGSTTLNKTSRLVVYGETTDSSQFALRTFSVGSDVLFGVRNDGLLVTGTLSLSPYNYSVTGRAVYVNSGGVIGYNSSTRESKSNINSINDISWINALNPVTFNKRKKDNEGNYIDEVYEELDYGFIADEVEQVNDNFVFYDIKDGQKVLAGVEYGKLTAVLVKVIQELKSQNDALQSRIETLESK